MVIFHGSKEIVEKPRIVLTKYNKDFSFGFYCTLFENQAVRWATRINGKGIINKYEYIKNSNLKIKEFPEMSEEWLDFIVACRNGEKHIFDIVEGPMADDQVYNYIQALMEGTISREAFWALAKFKIPTHQISFHTKESLQTIKFIKSEVVNIEK